VILLRLRRRRAPGGSDNTDGDDGDSTTIAGAITSDQP